MTPPSTPSPRYEMRRRLATRVLSRLQPGRFLEAGCGWGELLPTLVRLGYSGYAIEPSDEARAIALQRTSDLRDNVDVLSSIAELKDLDLDYVLAFEVLEHIENDVEEFAMWVSKLRSGGLSIISVPAHESRWTESDSAVGHFRRYSSDSLRRLHEDAGLSVIEFWSYGFPVTSVTRRLREKLNPRKGVSEDFRQRTLDSASLSHETMGAAGGAMSLMARVLGGVADLMQRPFVGTEWGDGFFVIAAKE